MPTAPRPPRAPNAPRAPSAPRAPRLSLSRWRDAASAALDGGTVKPRGEDEQPVPPFVRWPQFHSFLDEHWEAGEHLSVVAQTGSGKTTLIREVIDVREYVVWLATKLADDSAYPPLNPKLRELGFRVIDGNRQEFDPRSIESPRVVFYCPLSANTAEAEVRQRERLRALLRSLYISRGWTLVVDEVAYLSKDLRLDRELNAIWREGRSAGTTVVAGTQRPVNVPRNMWEMATHSCLFKITGKEDRDTASGYLGDLAGVANETVKQLPRYEFLYVDSIEAIAMRSRVEITYNSRDGEREASSQYGQDRPGADQRR